MTARSALLVGLNHPGQNSRVRSRSHSSPNVDPPIPETLVVDERKSMICSRVA